MCYYITTNDYFAVAISRPVGLKDKVAGYPQGTLNRVLLSNVYVHKP